jgi:hypothetical protein
MDTNLRVYAQRFSFIITARLVYEYTRPAHPAVLLAGFSDSSGTAMTLLYPARRPLC